MTLSEDRDVEALRAEEWVFHFMRGNVMAAAVVEQDGPPLRPSTVLAAVMSLLADQRLMLSPMADPEPTEEVDRADYVEG
ncbi:hypothetical protein ACNUDN_11720 [Mycobacterium sp. smrl_JER01]|uniref:hypothetical protein n=1 Tax=Mycobacterium sp. smrl_JER01 TaxID=3402633 RepID=UPI003AC6E2F9